MSTPATPSFAALFALVTGVDGPESRLGGEIAERAREHEAIVEMLAGFASPDLSAAEGAALARAVATGCLGERHLWRDMGLPSRASLRVLLEGGFPQFAADNVMDMRWKKFVYRRLCRWGGFATCSAPSCGVCPEYAECFGGQG